MSYTSRIKVGFIGTHFNRDHIVGTLMYDTISRLDKTQFETEIIHLGDDQNPNNAVFQLVSNVLDIRGTGLNQQHRAIAERKLDVLVYPEIGMDFRTYLLAFARLAPVQCVLPGHPITSGVANIDYYLSWDPLEAENAQDFYSEKLIRFQHNPFFISTRALKEHFAVRLMLDLDPDEHLYACMQALFKIHPDMDDAFAEILHRDTKGRILLPELPETGYEKVWKERFSRKYPDLTQRVTFLPRLPYGQFCAVLEHVDVLLDSFPFNGGTTSFSSFEMGAPIVTLEGSKMQDRATAVLYRQMQIPDAPVAKSPAEYVELALRLAHDKPLRQQLSSDILAACHILYGQSGSTAEFQRFLVAAHEAATQKREIIWPT